MVTAILGGAACAFEDFNELQEMAKPTKIVAVNDIGAYLPKVDVWCTLHIEKMQTWLNLRKEHGNDPAERLAFVTEPAGAYIRSFGYPPASLLSMYECDLRGGSGLFATMVAQSLFPGPVVLCGVPMDRVWAHFFDPSPWYDAPHYQEGWKANLNKLIPRVRSMSGWTRKVLGRPDTAWIEAKKEDQAC